MSLGRTQCFSTVELGNFEEQLRQSLDRVERLRDEEMKRKDVKTTDQINQLQRSINVAQRCISRLKINH